MFDLPLYHHGYIRTKPPTMSHSTFQRYIPCKTKNLHTRGLWQVSLIAGHTEDLPTGDANCPRTERVATLALDSGFRLGSARGGCRCCYSYSYKHPYSYSDSDRLGLPPPHATATSSCYNHNHHYDGDDYYLI